SVESDQTLLSSQVTTPNRDLDILDQIRREMQQMIESVEAKRLTAERESERRAELARELQMRQIRELAEKYGRIERTTTELPAISSEKDRLLAMVNTLQQRVDDLLKRLEDPERRIVQIEEQRRIDSRRLSELESEIPEVRRAVDSLKPKISLIEDLTLRNERRINDIVNTDRDRREQIQQFIDQQILTEQQREGQVQALLNKFAEQETQMQRNIERFETWAEAYREMKKIIDDFERIGERLERRINEVAEMQRLSEERFRQEWNDYRGEEQKRWKQFTLNTDEIWRQHDRDFERFTARLVQLEEALPSAFDAIQRLWQLERDRAQLYRERYQALLLEYDKGMPAPPVSQVKNGLPAAPAASGSGVTPSPLTAPPPALKTTTSTLPVVLPSAAPPASSSSSPLGGDSGGTG
ncbi:MAG: hypothetical protein NZM00_14700, partial [Anaerolinea sp.]|nr:hypothetical protein [Anaerolinea sp.]